MRKQEDLGVDLSGLQNLRSEDLDAETRELLKEALREDLAEKLALRRKRKDQVEKNKAAGIEMSKVYANGLKIRQRGCTHEKPRGLGTRWAAFKTSTGTLVVTCLACQKQFYSPPDLVLGQEAIPKAVLEKIDPDEVGGSI